MGDQFTVQHNSYADVNDGLVQQIVAMDTAMNDLNSALQNISTATGGQATPLWIDHQTQWNSLYADMKNQLNQHTNSSISAADTFHSGDTQGARIMS
jgi:leucyl aminopeptidase